MSATMVASPVLRVLQQWTDLVERRFAALTKRELSRVIDSLTQDTLAVQKYSADRGSVKGFPASEPVWQNTALLRPERAASASAVLATAILDRLLQAWLCGVSSFPLLGAPDDAADTNRQGWVNSQPAKV